MISIFPRDRELKVRQEILRGVYENNLEIIGKGRGSIPQKRASFVKKTLISLCLSLVIILGFGNYPTPSFIPERQVTASTILQQPLPGLLESRSNPSEYKVFISDPEMSLSRTFGLGVRTIMIDPGHGGADNGTSGRLGTREKDITLDIAKRLKTRLEKYGRFNIVMTRDADFTLPLNRRVKMAAESRADLFVSIHLNYLPAKPINIIETYYFGPSSDAKTQKLAELENAGSQYGMGDFREMIGKIGETLKLQESRHLAASIQRSLFLNINRESGNAHNFGVKRAPFVVLLGVDVPAVLAEVSCLSNQEEEMKLNTEGHREDIASYLEAGILDYLKKGEPHYEARRPER